MAAGVVRGIRYHEIGMPRPEPSSTQSRDVARLFILE